MKKQTLGFGGWGRVVMTDLVDVVAVVAGKLKMGN